MISRTLVLCMLIASGCGGASTPASTPAEPAAAPAGEGGNEEPGETDDCCCESTGDAVHHDRMSTEACMAPDMAGTCVDGSECVDDGEAE